MTTLTGEDVLEFQTIIKEEEGVEVPLEEARGAAERVVRLYEILILPPPEKIQPGNSS